MHGLLASVLSVIKGGEEEGRVLSAVSAGIQIRHPLLATQGLITAHKMSQVALVTSACCRARNQLIQRSEV